MEVVISYKTLSTLANGMPANVDMNRMLTSPGARTKVVATEAEKTAYIERETLNGYTCHVFKYMQSFESQRSVKSFSVIAA